MADDDTIDEDYETVEDDAAEDKAEKKGSEKAWAEVHKKALVEYDRDYAHEKANIDEAYEDLRFRRGRLADQWSAEALKSRKGRPCHVVNKLPQFIRQVTGDMRQSRPGIKVVPVDSGGDVETAEVRAGMIRYVENRSKAKHVYTTGADSQVTCGIGHWAVTTEYSHAGTFNQEIRIIGIEDGVSVLWDMDAILPSKSDADHCFVPSDMSMAKFKERWPSASPAGFDAGVNAGLSSATFDGWMSDDSVRVVQYWKKKPIKRTLALMQDGEVVDLTDKVKGIKAKDMKRSLDMLRQQTGARVEQRDSYTICRYLISMTEVLEEAEWPGMNIPVIPLIGEEVRVGREVYRHGIVRYARDLQRMENYYASAETEVVALQPKAPWIGTKTQFKDNYDLWETANTENHPFLEYTPDPLAPGPPQRIQPPVASQAISEGKMRVSEDMKAVIGIYDSSLGAKSNETSGIAIARRDAQGDTGTFVYHDNFAMAIERTAEIVNELFPHIYDTQRTIQILGDDGTPEMKKINEPKVVDGINKVLHDMTSGSYDVVMEKGPSYATKRQQAQDSLTQFIQAFPPAAPLIGDIYAKIMDFPHSQEIGERLEEALPPAIKQKLQAERKEAETAGKPPQPPTPQEQQADQQKQAAEQEAQQAKQMQMAELKGKADKAMADAATAAENARKAKAEADRAELETQILRQRLAESHMGSLRSIEMHDHDMADGHTQRLRGAALHDRDMQHAQDGHEIGMTERGLAAGQSVQQHLNDMASTQMAAEQPLEQPLA